jgi:hypothetical protein
MVSAREGSHVLGFSVSEEVAMKSFEAVCAGVLLVSIACMTGCTKSADKAMSSGGTAAATNAMAAGMSLVDQLGGMSGVVKLADSFGAHLASNPIVAKLLDAAAITQVKNGLVNDIAKASGMAPPNPGADLMSALSGKGLDADALNGVTQALSAAADDEKVPAAQKSALMGLLTPITSALGGK